MALDTYSNLKAAIERYVGRNDISDVVDDAIDITESRMYANPLQPLRLRSMETRTTDTLSTSSRFLSLPSGFLQIRRFKVQLAGGDCDIRYRAPDQLQTKSQSGIPRFYTITSEFEFERTPDSAYTVEVQYYQRLTALSGANTTNDVLTNYPDIYLYGSLWVINQFAAEEDKADYFEAKFLDAIVGANKQDKKGRYGSSPVMRTEGVTP